MAPARNFDFGAIAARAQGAKTPTLDLLQLHELVPAPKVVAERKPRAPRTPRQPANALTLSKPVPPRPKRSPKADRADTVRLYTTVPTDVDAAIAKLAARRGGQNEKSAIVREALDDLFGELRTLSATELPLRLAAIRDETAPGGVFRLYTLRRSQREQLAAWAVAGVPMAGPIRAAIAAWLAKQDA